MLATSWTEPSDRSDEGDLERGDATALLVLSLRDSVRGVFGQFSLRYDTCLQAAPVSTLWSLQRTYLVSMPMPFSKHQSWSRT